ncbi:MAG: amidohydrolase family protein [Woeseiaceae bacterium]
MIALVGGNLLDGYEAAPIHDAVVVLKGDRIVATGTTADTDVPADAHVINTRGKTIMPGLIDLHCHVDLIGHGDYETYYEFMRKRGGIEISREIASKHLIRAGVTTALDLGSSLDILETRARIAAGEIPGPSLLVSGPWLSRLPVGIVPDDMQIIISSPREAASRTRELIDSGVDVIKAWEGLTAADYEAIVREAHQRGIKVHAHLYDPAKVRLALDAGVDVLQHMGSAKNPPYSDELVAEIAHRNIPVVQTIAHRIWVYPATVRFPARLQSVELRSDLPDDIYEEFQRSFRQFWRLDYFRRIGRETRLSTVAARQFIDANAYMGVGTDGGSPMNFHFDAMWREMAALADAGMTEIQVISAATKTNAEILGNLQLLGGKRDTGTVEAGMRADVIVVDGDPLFDMSVLDHVQVTIVGGRIWYSDQWDAPEEVRSVGQRL